MPANKKKPAKEKLNKLTNKKKSSESKGRTTRDATFKNYKKAIIASGGFITIAAKSLGVTHSAVSLYIKAHPELQDLIEEIQESYLDFAESQLISLIKAKDKAAIFFYLKCKGKERGYIERAEYDLKTPGDPVKLLFQSVEKQVETNPELKDKLDKELDDN